MPTNPYGLFATGVMRRGMNKAKHARLSAVIREGPREAVIKLTKIQREILETLRDGAVMVVDKHNIAAIGGRMVQPQTRDFLTSHRLVTRLDKERAVGAQGNGFVISQKGLEALAQTPPA